jgi:hypothetical protein
MYGISRSAGLHYIDVQDEEISGGCPSYSPPEEHPKKECHFVYDRDCPNDICVAGAIQNYTHQLEEWSSVQTVHYLRKRSSWSSSQGSGGARLEHQQQPPVNQHFREALMFVTQ